MLPVICRRFTNRTSPAPIRTSTCSQLSILRSPRECKPGDPFTPLLRAYENDKVQIRILVGAHEETHNLTINGHKWLHQPGTPQDPLAVNNSGYRNSQVAGISEHFEFLTGKESILGNRPFIDYLYQNSASVDGQWNGVWGIFRVYNGRAGIQADLMTLPNNIGGRSAIINQRFVVHDGLELPEWCN